MVQKWTHAVIPILLRNISIDDKLTNIWTLVYFPRIVTDKYVNNCKYFFCLSINLKKKIFNVFLFSRVFFHMFSFGWCFMEFDLSYKLCCIFYFLLSMPCIKNKQTVDTCLNTASNSAIAQSFWMDTWHGHKILEKRPFYLMVIFS